MLSHRAIFNHAIPQTYFAEVWSNMDDWCKENCKGKFELEQPYDVKFELMEDLEKFILRWYGKENALIWKLDAGKYAE